MNEQLLHQVLDALRRIYPQIEATSYQYSLELILKHREAITALEKALAQSEETK